MPKARGGGLRPDWEDFGEDENTLQHTDHGGYTMYCQNSNAAHLNYVCFVICYLNLKDDF